MAALDLAAAENKFLKELKKLGKNDLQKCQFSDLSSSCSISISKKGAKMESRSKVEQLW
jgi:hypothetical protein